MSWSLSMASRGSDLAARVSDSLSYAKAAHNVEQKPVVEAIEAAAVALGAAYPEKVVVFETSGHLDGNAGNFTVSVKVISF